MNDSPLVIQALLISLNHPCSLELSLYLLHDKLVEAGIEAEQEAGGQNAQEAEAD